MGVVVDGVDPAVDHVEDLDAPEPLVDPGQRGLLTLVDDRHMLAVVARHDHRQGEVDGAVFGPEAFDPPYRLGAGEDDDVVDAVPQIVAIPRSVSSRHNSRAVSGSWSQVCIAVTGKAKNMSTARR